MIFSVFRRIKIRRKVKLSLPSFNFLKVEKDDGIIKTQCNRLHLYPSSTLEFKYPSGSKTLIDCLVNDKSYLQVGNVEKRLRPSDFVPWKKSKKVDVTVERNTLN